MDRRSSSSKEDEDANVETVGIKMLQRRVELLCILKYSMLLIRGEGCMCAC